jgi:excisionase family DNA binding protein
MGKNRRMTERVRPSHIPYDFSPPGGEANAPNSQNTLTTEGQGVRDPRADKSNVAPAQGHGSGLSKRPRRKSDPAAELLFDDRIPAWARSETKAADRAIVRWARCTAPRTGLPREAAQEKIVRGDIVPLLTAPLVAELLNISPRTVRRLIARGELAVVRIGRSVRIRAAALERLMLGGDGGGDGEVSGGGYEC